MEYKDEIKEELKKDFELERLKLFSDAVFAIVITLVAIEIKLPHFEEEITEELLKNALIHLLPVMISYIISFCFIGMQWYYHFKLFKVLKTYDLGLILRNFLVLFFMGLFPFGVSLFSEVGFTSNLFSTLSLILFGIYLSISIGAGFSGAVLGKYIISKPELLDEDADISELILQFDYTKWFDKETIKKKLGR